MVNEFDSQAFLLHVEWFSGTSEKCITLVLSPQADNIKNSPDWKFNQGKILTWVFL